MKKSWFWIGAFIVIIGAIFVIRLISPEDDWICQNGAWTEHGHPDAPMPTSICE